MPFIYVDMHIKTIVAISLLASERSERDTLRSVQSRIAIYICVCVAVIVRMSLLSFDL